MAMELRFHIIDKAIHTYWRCVVLHVNTGNIKFSDLNGQIVFGDLSTDNSTFQFSAPIYETKQLALPLVKVPAR